MKTTIRQQEKTMPERKSTPGPFWANHKQTRTIYRGKGIKAVHICQLSALRSAAEREELVDLLNKGTHYDALLEAAEGVIDISDYAHRPVRLEKQIERQSLCPVAEDRLNTLRAAIAECGETTHEDHDPTTKEAVPEEVA